MSNFFSLAPTRGPSGNDALSRSCYFCKYVFISHQGTTELITIPSAVHLNHPSRPITKLVLLSRSKALHKSSSYPMTLARGDRRVLPARQKKTTARVRVPEAWVAIIYPSHVTVNAFRGYRFWYVFVDETLSKKEKKYKAPFLSLAGHTKQRRRRNCDVFSCSLLR